ncbi:MBL fold metallo-hydrolase [Marininema halotolerans]|uniref:L-ascorbate metabolism protein UlaG, beta-lactamase superfamily n=1 Tax=Marininema halotolerans TaxID=1155944 RepID=A0A1I6TDS3_9BACL|nr:MBL fold metallo-hydrolase [Marininema halotolerans]SFS87335.1 L-ascorbate metabolism protein UlaG, beta-lactamase superfamily [Marininema halotolerans]
MLWIVVAIGFSMVLLALVFMNRYQVFRGKATSKQLQRYEESDHFANGKFVNAIPTPIKANVATFISLIGDYFKKDPHRRPTKPLAVKSVELPPLKENGSARVTWLGHSTVLLQIKGKTILFDPLFGTTPTPFPIIGGRRFNKEFPLKVDDLPAIDAVIISHDHFDHLEYDSIRKLKKVKKFYAPLGVKNLLVRWGVDSAKIEELDWWEETEYDGLSLAFTPARHFSGRGLFASNTTLWGSWVVMAQDEKIFFGGDSGYGPHFKEIGERYGPFDIAMIESGQYDHRWSTIHMQPEESIQAFQDVKGKVMIPIHWGSFTLAFHDWTDPAERGLKLAEKNGLIVAFPQIGEAIEVGERDYPSAPWWRDYHGAHN